MAANADEPQFWSYCGSSYDDRRDWLQPVKQGFAQDNFLGMSASDYGGGTPIVDVWRRDAARPRTPGIDAAARLTSSEAAVEGRSLEIHAKVKHLIAAR